MANDGIKAKMTGYASDVTCHSLGLHTSFSFVFRKDVFAEIKMLNVSKAIQESDILVKIIKRNESFFTKAILFYFNKSLEN